MRKWREITALPNRRRSESLVQSIFDSWPKRTKTIAGAPTWLRKCRESNKRESFDAFGYSFTPDVLWNGERERYLLELKCANKYEPLALAEALHHAQILEALYSEADQLVVPVLVTMYSPWLRAAVARLRSSAVVVHSLEMDILEDDVQGDTAFWFDDPHADWTPSEVPEVLRASHLRHWNWHYVDATSTWIAIKGKLERRPVFFEEPYVMVARAFGPADRELDEYYLWQGTPPRRHSGSSPEHWGDSAFYKWATDGTLSDLPPL